MASLKAYAPYSGFRVGAAILTGSGDVHAGCNVENASYGATICAERAAVCALISAHGQQEITEIVVVTDAVSPWPPCGVCRQVLWEFGPRARVWWANLQGQASTSLMSELLPHAFSPEDLADSR